MVVLSLKCLQDLRDLSSSADSILYTDRELIRDFAYIESRAEHEGVSFFTKTLPALGKWYDSLLAGQDPVMVAGFKPLVANKTCPVFFRYFYLLIHSDEAPEQRSHLIRVCRTILYLFYKVETDLTPDVVSDALAKWYETEEELSNLSLPAYYDEIAFTARDLIAHVTSNLSFDIKKCRHGTGAVAYGEKLDDKWVKPRYSRALHNILPWYDVYFGWRSTTGQTNLAPELIKFGKSIQWVENWTSRLLFVPKDSRGPRVISCEPKELMFLQQGLRADLQPEIERMTHHRVNFVSQTTNQELARKGSLNGEWATIDLSDASDRVSIDLVNLIWDLSPIYRWIMALRSSHTLLPNGDLHEHRKYAPMGSALCFPVESLTFWALCVACLKARGVDAAESLVYVYGDDIIVPTVHSLAVMDTLERFGLRVNRTKSYTDGPFRESCGLDAWHGQDVTPQKIRKFPDLKPSDGVRLVAWCDYASRFNMVYAMYRAGGYCHELLRNVLGFIPRTLAVTNGLTIQHPTEEDLPPTSWDVRTCRLRFKGHVVKTSPEKTHIDGLSRLNKWAFGSWVERDPSLVVLPYRTQIKRGWVYIE